MRILANIFLILFLADASVSFLDEVVSLLSQVSPISGLRNILAYMVMAVAVPLYFCLGIDRRLPKQVFLPLIAFIFFGPLLSWLLPVLGEHNWFGLVLSTLQLVLLALPVYRFRKNGAHSFIMQPESLSGVWFSLKNTVVFFCINLVILPVSLAIFAFHAVSVSLEAYTAGFMRLRPTGIYMAERVYRRDGKTVRLASMIHVGEKQYYDDLVASLSQGSSIVLAEGVTDDKKLLQNRLDYQKVAGFLGLTPQQKMQFKGRLLDDDALDDPLQQKKEKRTESEAGQADIMRADVDVSSFRSATLVFLNAVGKHMSEGEGFISGAMALNGWTEKHITPEMSRIIMEDILQRRNKVVLGYLGKALKRYDAVIIPWGALHMPEVEEDVVNRGFELVDERQRQAVSFFDSMRKK